MRNKNLVLVISIRPDSMVDAGKKELT